MSLNGKSLFGAQGSQGGSHNSPTCDTSLDKPAAIASDSSALCQGVADAGSEHTSSVWHLQAAEKGALPRPPPWRVQSPVGPAITELLLQMGSEEGL